jgi:hypothetical protein
MMALLSIPSCVALQVWRMYTHRGVHGYPAWLHGKQVVQLVSCGIHSGAYLPFNRPQPPPLLLMTSSMKY